MKHKRQTESDKNILFLLFLFNELLRKELFQSYKFRNMMEIAENFDAVKRNNKGK